MNKKIVIILISLIALLFILFITRVVNPRQIDDISPEIPCEQEYLEKSDILWVIPKFNDIPIDQYPEWCNQILNLNKTLGLHGLHHNYQEFNSEITQEQLQEAVTIFESCFNQTPKLFKPPQLKISKENKILIKQNNLKLNAKLNQLTHKVYHCSHSGQFSNKFIDGF
ncbi:MAG: DUF2334 domain-containing protein [Nanoarchaeota archaeon]|nr:DUF2334 domain-containing protein [Nanoarchaeota archaeon]MBU1988562.1 DUF2334 domain-containing protein [Nanoarchaeota archaeon]